MKNTLRKTLKILLYPVTSCWQILQDASDHLPKCAPVGLTDYLNYVEAEKICRKDAGSPRRHSLQVSLNYAHRG